MLLPAIATIASGALTLYSSAKLHFAQKNGTQAEAQKWKVAMFALIGLLLISLAWLGLSR